MFRAGFCFKLFLFFIVSFPTLATEPDKIINQQLTKLFLPNWPYEAFLAIPRISEMRPTLGIEISKEDNTLYSLSCIEIYYHDMQKKFEPKTLLERESLHKLLCKSMKRAMRKTPLVHITQNFPNSYNIALRFDFFNGKIQFVETPYPPLDPLLKLEDIFLDEDDILNFGDIDFPDELEVEINQTPL